MKIKVKEKSYSDVMAINAKNHSKVKVKKQSLLFRTLLYIVSMPTLIGTHFKCEKVNMDKIGKKTPCLILMNHSSFIDLKIASVVLFPRRFNIICTSDGFVGKNWLMENLGCIPTNKFVFDVGLVRNILRAVKKNNSSVLMYPEASYSFDGTATPLPDSIGRFVKMLSVPVVMINTYGAFARDPLYNNLQLRKVDVSAKMECILNCEDIVKMSEDDINSKINSYFGFDNFRWQQENKVKISEDFRADMLNRVLYKCPNCNAEGSNIGKGVYIKCKACGAKHFLNEYGYLEGVNCDTVFSHIPDWYAWERECVRKEINNGSYSLFDSVEIYMLVDKKYIYHVGDGILTHSLDGFHLSGCNGELEYHQAIKASYSLYSDFNWYEMGDVICIGNRRELYYCFPKNKKDIVAKARLATEEMYKLYKENKSIKN